MACNLSQLSGCSTFPITICRTGPAWACDAVRERPAPPSSTTSFHILRPLWGGPASGGVCPVVAWSSLPRCDQCCRLVFNQSRMKLTVRTASMVLGVCFFPPAAFTRTVSSLCSRRLSDAACRSRRGRFAPLPRVQNRPVVGGWGRRELTFRVGTAVGRGRVQASGNLVRLSLRTVCKRAPLLCGAGALVAWPREVPPFASPRWAASPPRAVPVTATACSPSSASVCTSCRYLVGLWASDLVTQLGRVLSFCFCVAQTIQRDKLLRPAELRTAIDFLRRG